ncbi:MAG TPA: glycoside hydrolase family 3 N-terminal domain-containing protein [Actinophytocola sp.]|uniref:glycoside hydrolase family 3 protein n=1 Tax=Actinophytocola sp. TaxID=1872138 RepID=UPI002DDCA900|nr:glycoside hydrolase family 3 N-terminal domain-containing protein [Actinophytocola sp.]HEV2782472.1 glycoside hydrolase family 3 N-terminal domain-containing protein [Actinophytocola sp.]
MVVSVCGTPSALAEPRGGSEVFAGYWANQVLNRLSLEQKVGQLFVVSVWGKSADEAHPTNRTNYGVDTPAQVVERYNVGGVIYFNNATTDNVDDPRQVANFSNGLQRAAVRSGLHLPLIIAIDQEGGNVTRLESPATEFPGSMAIGAGRSATDARSLATINGHELRAMGINQNFAPVADVNSNPLNPVIGARSFSSRPDLASQLVRAEVSGLEDSDRPWHTVSSAAKHFPGHGDADTDSHTTLPIINRTADAVRQIDLPPFKAAIEAGVDVIMTAHIMVPSLDDSRMPATLSRPILTGILREELGFRGVIVTDALGMGGANVLPPEEIPLRAIEAGADQMLMPPNLELAKSSVVDAVRSGRISEQRINESVLRILLLKFKRAILTSPFVDVDKVDGLVGTPANLAEIQRISDRTTTVLRNDAGVLPARPTNVLVTGIGDGAGRSPGWLAASLTARGLTATALPTGSSPGEALIAQAETAAQGADLVVVLTNNLSARLQQRTLLSRLLATGKPVVAVASQVPYDAGFVDAPTWVATYSWRAVSMESLAKVLLGEISPRGKLPVDVPAGGDPTTIRYPFDTGLTW